MVEERKRRIKYEIICPNCKAHYWLELINDPTHELCPHCGEWSEIEKCCVKKEIKNVRV